MHTSRYFSAAVLITLALAQISKASAQDSLLLNGMRWRNVGPNRGGRVTTVTGVPSQPNTFYMGVASGGVWRTTDAGASWNPISDRHFDVASIGDIAVSLSDPNTIYVGTGSDGLRSNVSTGRGVYKSNDNGQSWSFVGLRDVGQIGAVRIHPTDPNVAYVAATGNIFKRNTERGVFKTTDGGRTWRKVLYISDSTGAADVELQPGNPNVVFAVMSRAERKPWTIISGANEGGIYKSTNGGETWTRLSQGLPSGLIGKGNIGVTPANPNRLYLLYEAKPGGGMYRSDDAGSTWTQTSSMGALIQRPFYYTTLTADPTNADVVWAGAEGFYKSTDAGRTFRPVPTPHGDNHDIWINPNNNNILVQANDGGANVSLDGARTWSTQYNQPTAEMYQVYLDNQFPYRLYGAQQDNSTLIVPSLPLNTGQSEEWRAGPGCETGPILPHPTNPDTVYASCKGQFSRMSLRTGNEKQYWIGMQSLYGNPGKDLILRFQRVSPMEISPFDARTLYYGSQYVHRTRDEGVTWERISPDLTWNPPERQQKSSGEPITLDVTGEEYYSTLYAIEESPIERGVIWTGANDGPYHVTRNDGQTWTNVTPRDLPRGCRVGSIDPSRHGTGTAYFASYCYLLGDFAPYIYKTSDYGRTWKRLTTGSNGIAADNPTRVVREDPHRQGLLYAGTEFGMYVSLDDGGTWQKFMQNMPVVPINDIKVHRQDLVIATQGRGFWILDNLTPLHTYALASRTSTTAEARAMAGPAYLFQPREQFRVRYSAGRSRDVSEPQYPPPGAQFDYWLPSVPQGDVRLEVLDAQRRVIRSYVTAEPQRTQRTQSAAPRDPDEDMRPAGGGGGGARLTKSAGLNRFTWDLRHPGPWNAATRGNSPGGGPMAVPGNYFVRLVVGDFTTEQPWVLSPDPRVVNDGVTVAVMQEQFDFAMKARDLVSETNQLVASLRAGRQRLSNATGAAADTLRMIQAVEAKLLTPPIRYSKPGLQAHINYLYSITNQADQKPGRDWYERYDVLRKELDALKAEAGRISGLISE
ncbi:MAG TPA: hypothetical protein VEB19_07710 [Gemmatimonadaceae bacterium]|nr:hypothetical protein [Gemmatimonadaceae bacterium]